MKQKGKHIRLLFKIGVVFKGIDGAIETVAGIALFFTTTASLCNLVGWITHGEMQEDPTDFVSTHLVNFFQHLSVNTKYFVSVYLLSHGLAKVVLAIGLLRGKLWAYPTALTIFGLFLCYQIYRFAHNHSMGLGLISLLDVIILVLILREYKCLKASCSHA
jgi:uncharacterized membrane protein